ncbi:MAG: DUF11 domain-containing protein [Pseudomonadota bacterium]
MMSLCGMLLRAPVLLLALALLGLCAPAHADTPISLWKSFNGSVNFTGTQVTLRTRSNAVDACAVAPSTSNRSAELTLPAGATVLSAQLYWAGSGPADNSVSFEGKAVTAARRYSSATVGNGMNYFGGAADVTATVKAKGAGNYRFSGLTVSTGRPWCASQAVLGGFSLLVVYAHPNEPERVLNLYEGFRYVQNGEITFTATNFRWPKPWWPIREKARVGHITWEGDSTLLGDGERLIFEGRELTDDMNPAGNQFNSRSNINRDFNSYGVDFDAYDTEVVQWIFYEPSVTTTYRTGQDLVLLNAEILVVPTLPVSDLSIEMSRGGPLQVGQQASYTLVVSNNGPYTEAGPITVTDTLPNGMSFVSASGVNWTCSASGQVVTCTYSKALGPNLSAPPVTIIASVTQGGTMTNTAQVTGTADNNKDNDRAVDEAVASGTPASIADYVFTSVACQADKVVGSTDCPRYTANVTGGANTRIYVTAVNGARTVALSGNKDTQVSMQFSLSCNNPAAGKVGASYAGLTLPACAKGWSGAVNMLFPANSASASAPAYSTFNYPDVGSIALNLLTGGKTNSTSAFVARPYAIAFKSIKNPAGRQNPGATGPEGPGFAAAGETLQLEIGALLADGTSFAQNFGNEKVAPSVTYVPQQLMENEGIYTMSKLAAASGALTGTFAWSEVGILNLVPSLADYLTTGAVMGRRVTVGRFYPSYFDTAVDAPFTCQPSMNCPAEVAGGAYSRQPFGVTVEAFNAGGDSLSNYAGGWRRPITLSAVTARGGAEDAGTLEDGALGRDEADVPKMQGAPSFALADKYDANAGAVRAWAVPQAIYLRATSEENLAGGGIHTVTSRRDAVPETSSDDGVLILNGRLQVANTQGVGHLPTPVGLQAQYWNGQHWLNNTGLEGVAINAGGALFSNCVGSLAVGAGCSDKVAALVDQSISLTQGRGIFRLAAPGAVGAGSVGVQMALPSWLPSTRGRVSFGARRSPLIYVREIY